MSNKNITADQSNNLVFNNQVETGIDYKLDELIDRIRDSKLSRGEIKLLQQKIGADITTELSPAEKILAFKEVTKDNPNRETLVNDLELLLVQTKLDSKITTRYLFNKQAKKVMLLVLGLVLLAMGFAMLVLPAPQYLEVFTVFYFNANDGVTLMDIISLLIVFTGVYLILISLLRTIPGKATNA